MEKLHLRDSGPFSPEEAAKRVKLASQQLKWFTLCHPHWPTAHYPFELATTFPLPSLPIPKGVRITALDCIRGEFQLSPSGEELIAGAVSANLKLSGDLRIVFSVSGHGLPDNPGLYALSFIFNEHSEWEVWATVYHRNVKDKNALIKSAVETGHLGAAKNWKFVEYGEQYESKTGNVETRLELVIARNEIKNWSPVLGEILSAQPKPLKAGSWRVVFDYFQKDKRRIVCKVAGLKYADKIIEQVNVVNFPGNKAKVKFWCTVDHVEDYLALFKFATLCKPNSSWNIGIFETDKGKQGIIRFNFSPKGIELKVQYGPNGWEEVHEILQRNNGKLVL